MLLVCVFRKYCELPSVLRASISSISSFVLPYFLAVFCLSLPALPPLRVFQGKTHPAPSARPFGAMRRLELWY